MAENKKKSLLDNYAFIHIDQNNTKKAQLIPAQEDIDRMVEAMEIKDGDIIIKLTEETLSIAELVNHIQLV